MILSDRGKKHVEAITKYCLENGMEDVSMMGLRNHLVRLVNRIEILEERAAKQKESSPTSHNKQSTPLLCRNVECDHCRCICLTQKCDYFKG